MQRELAKQKRYARNEVIARFDDTIGAMQRYIDEFPDGEERGRLVGQIPDLRDVRHRFELATAPDDES